MISKWLFSGAFLFELSSWASVFADLPIGQALALYLFAHGLGSALLCVGVWLLLPRRYKFPLPWSPLFLFSLAFFVPLIGAVGVAAAVFPALYLPRQRGEQAWQAMGVPELPFRPKEKRLDMMFSDGGLQDVLRHAPDPNQRLTAIFATRRMPGKEAIPILKLALRDPADDVRLLAYSMLDQKESRINQRIEAALGRLAGATRRVARDPGALVLGTGLPGVGPGQRAGAHPRAGARAYRPGAARHTLGRPASAGRAHRPRTRPPGGCRTRPPGRRGGGNR